MKNYRTWGAPPYNVAVVHGGPGATGGMAEVADELSKAGISILEPQQTALSVDGQAEELRGVLEQQAAAPLILIGHSWGAWLIFITVSRFPELIKKLILVCSGPFEAKYAVGLDAIRESRLSKSEKHEMNELWDMIKDAAVPDKDKCLARIGELAEKADTYEPLPEKRYEKPEGLAGSAEIYNKIMPEAIDLRRSGRLLAMGNKIMCPVTAIHGSYDPHPGEGVKEPLSRVFNQFKFIELDRCGHEPWREKYARDEFFQILMDEIKQASAIQ